MIERSKNLREARVGIVFILLIIVILLRLAGRSNALKRKNAVFLESYSRQHHLVTDCITENRIQSRQCRILPSGIVFKKNLGKNTWRLSQDLICTYQSLLSLWPTFALLSSIFLSIYIYFQISLFPYVLSSFQSISSFLSISSFQSISSFLFSFLSFLHCFRFLFLFIFRLHVLSFPFNSFLVSIYHLSKIIPDILVLKKFPQLRTSFKFRRSATFTPNLVSTSFHSTSPNPTKKPPNLLPKLPGHHYPPWN